MNKTPTDAEAAAEKYIHDWPFGELSIADADIIRNAYMAAFAAGLEKGRAEGVDTSALYFRIKEWMKTDKPPHLAFTEGLERVVATLIAESRAGGGGRGVEMTDQQKARAEA